MAKLQEYDVVTGLPPQEFTARLGELSAGGWEVVAFEAGGVPGTTGVYTALVRREAPRRRLAAEEADAATGTVSPETEEDDPGTGLADELE